MQRQWLFSHKWTLGALVLLSLLLSASLIAQAYSIVHIIDFVFLHKQFEATVPYFIVLAGAMLVRLLTHASIDKLGSQLAYNVKQRVRKQLLTAWRSRNLLAQFSKQTGEQASLFIQTVDELEPYYRDYIPQAIKSTIIPLVLLIAVFATHANSGWIMLITAPFIPLTYIIVGIQTKHKAEQQLEAMNRFSGTFLDLLQGMQTIRLFRQQREKQDILKDSNAQFLHKTMDVLKIAFASTLFIELITTLGIGLVALEIGFQMIVFDTLAFAPAFFILILAPEYYNALKQLGAAFHTAKGSEGAMSLLTNELTAPMHPVLWGERPIACAPTVHLQHIRYTHQDGPTIGPLSLTVRAKQTVAIIGPTGHGKSTLLNLLAGAMNATDGDYLLNGIARHVYDEASFYSHMTFISQRTHLFAGTLRDNILLGQQASDKDLLRALQEAQLLDWFQTLPNGLDTELGEGGRGLSGGEQQRVAIARAFVKKAPFVLFDEPTANLDATSEQLVSDALRVLSEDATTIIVSHRYETIRAAQMIYVLEHGRIVAQGTPDELQHPLYLQMKEGSSRC